MKILKKVASIEVRRAFVIANHITDRKDAGNNRTYLKAVSEEEFRKRLLKTKKAILKLKAEKLDTLVSPKWPKRLKAYKASDWFLAEVSPKEVGVWRRAGNLPLEWTNRSLFETAQKVKIAFDKNSKLLRARPRHSIPNVLKLKTHLNQKEKYLYPIVFKGGTGTLGRKRLRFQTKGDIDDGCMRSIALAISGRNPIKVYFGVPPREA